MANTFDNILSKLSLQRISENEKQIEVRKFIQNGNSVQNFITGGYGGITNEISNVIHNSQFLFTNRNPFAYVPYSELMSMIFTPYKKAIETRATFLGTVKVENKKNNPKLKQIIDFLELRIPIYGAESILPQSYGLNSLLNYISIESDTRGMCFAYLERDAKTMNVLAIRLFRTTDFIFTFDEYGKKQLYFTQTGKVVNLANVYVFAYKYENGYDWGCPLIYGGKFMGDIMIKLLNAQANGLMRNMNPFEMTIISTDVEKIKDAGGKESMAAVQSSVESLRENIKNASSESLKGKSVHLIQNVPNITNFIHTKAASDIKFMDNETFDILLQLATAPYDVPYPMLMAKSGAMNTDQSKMAVIQMETKAAQFLRPQILPIIDNMTMEICRSNGYNVYSEDLSVVFNPSIMYTSTLDQKTTVIPTVQPI